MIELQKINNKTMSQFNYIEYLGTEFGDTEIVNMNRWSAMSVSPMNVSINRHLYTNATIRFMIQGAPTQVDFEESITAIVMEFRETAPVIQYNGFNFMGHATDFKTERIVKSQVAEITITLEGIKYVPETVTISASTPSRVYFNKTLIDSPIIISFTALDSGDITIDGRTMSFYDEGNWVIDGFNHTVTLDGDNALIDVVGVFFPSAKKGGAIISTTMGGVVTITCMRRLL